MQQELQSLITELKTEIHATTHPLLLATGTLSASTEDPCQTELDALDSLGTEFDTFIEDFRQRLAAAVEAYQCCRVAYPETPPAEPL